MKYTQPRVIGNATLYLGDCREILPTLAYDAVVTDPPYPNNAGHFLDGIQAACDMLAMQTAQTAIVFWSEIERPPCPLPLVAVHVWHRTNVNGRPYEPAYHFAGDGEKRRSDVIQHAAVFDGAGPGCQEYEGHPTQKPVAMMERLVAKTTGTVLDPFMGVGATGLACLRLGRPFVGVELNPTYFDTALRRMEDAQRQGRLIA